LRARFFRFAVQPDVANRAGGHHLGNAHLAGSVRPSGQGGHEAAEQQVGDLVRRKVDDPLDRAVADQLSIAWPTDAVAMKANNLSGHPFQRSPSRHHAIGRVVMACLGDRTSSRPLSSPSSAPLLAMATTAAAAWPGCAA